MNILILLIFISISSYECRRHVSYEPIILSGRVQTLEDVSNEAVDDNISPENFENIPFNENTINSKSSSSNIINEQKDVTPCVPGGDVICNGVGEPLPEDIINGGTSEGGVAKEIPGKPMRAVVNDLSQLWRSSNVKFSIANNVFTASQKRLLIQAMEEIELKSCVRFQQISFHKPDTVYITKITGVCGADVGRRSYRGYQRLMLGDDCFGTGSASYGKGIIIHELMHILGFYHEMARPDRDNYVSIHWSNIMNGMEYNFDKYVAQQINTLGLPYDYDSIMHYSKYDFSRTGYVPTVTTKQPFRGNLGQRSYLSAYDVLKLNKAYNCGGDAGLEVKPNRPVVVRPPRTKKRPDYPWYR